MSDQKVIPQNLSQKRVFVFKMVILTCIFLYFCIYAIKMLTMSYNFSFGDFGTVIWANYPPERIFPWPSPREIVLPVVTEVVSFPHYAIAIMVKFKLYLLFPIPFAFWIYFSIKNRDR